MFYMAIQNCIAALHLHNKADSINKTEWNYTGWNKIVLFRNDQIMYLSNPI